MATFRSQVEKLLKTEEVDQYREIVKNSVMDLMKQVSDENPMFSDYKVLLSGSTREDVRVGNPYEIDYLIQYDIKANIIELSSYPGYVRIVPSQDDSIKFRSIMEEDVLSCNKLMFKFLMIVFNITRGPEYKSKEIRFSLEFTSKEKRIGPENFRRATNIGAALPFRIAFPEYNFNYNIYETVDVVLSLHCEGYWPKCACGWKRKYEHVLERKFFDSITEYGVSMVCKVPVEDTELFEGTPEMFRLSFSVAESHLFDHVTSEQKEAYRMMKILRETHLTDYIFLEILHIGDQLKKRFTSYHMKSVFLSLTIGNDENCGAREWLVLLLEALIDCLQKQSIKHHFIDDCELFVNISMEEELQEHFKHNLVKDFDITLNDFKMTVPPEFILGHDDTGKELHTSKILESIFTEILETLPDDLSELNAKCSYKNVCELLL